VTSDLHKHLQNKGREYLLNKQYWVRTVEMPTPAGIVDVWGINNANNLETACIEVKVSRGDYRSRSQKYKEFNVDRLANYCYLLCPEGLIGKHESLGWGILWYYKNSDRLRLMRKPTRLEQTERNKLQIMVRLFDNRANKPDNLLLERR